MTARDVAQKRVAGPAKAGVPAMRLESGVSSAPASSASAVSSGSSDASSKGSNTPRNGSTPGQVEVNVAQLPSNYRPTSAPSLTPPSKSGARKGFNLFVGTLPNITTQEALEILFAPFGQLLDTYLLKQEGKGRYRCGFVSYAEYHSAAHAIARLNGFVWYEGASPICVRFANPPKAAADAAATAPGQASPGTPAAAVTGAAAGVRGEAGVSPADYTAMLLNGFAVTQAQQVLNNGMGFLMGPGLSVASVPESPLSSTASIGPDGSIATMTPDASRAALLRMS